VKERKLYVVAVIGAIICFTGDNLLGYFVPTSDFGNKLMCINFSYEWADADPIRFVMAGLCGVVALLMMFVGFYGIYSRIKDDRLIAKSFIFASFVFVSVGTLYHNVFAVAAYIYNKLIQNGFGNAQAFTMDVFNTFILVGSLAAVGYAVMVIIIFIESIRGKVFPFKWMCVMNPFLIMIVCIVLSKILPQTAFVNGVFGLGQQSIGLFILFVTLYLTCRENN
jgi:hypothetical protein